MSARDVLAEELSRCWYELGSMLRDRRLLTSLHGGEAQSLTPTKLRAISVLAEHGELRVGELATWVGVDETTATRLVDRLESSGLAERRRLEDDRRVAVVVLTASGADVAAAVADERRRFFADVLDALQPNERRELVRLTGKAARALRETSRELIAR
ncbi:MAG TPA: MarR family transcriptional regulator [Gaiellaceae bacterium]|jgi:DNA-binding MarR family transcriptional regulator